MRKVLVVEDEPLIRLSVIDFLEDAGFEVIEAASADEAVDLLGDHVIHLLFTDVQMPGTLSGVDLAQDVARRFPNAGIIVASGRLLSRDLDLPPAAEFFSKPYDLNRIVARLIALSE